MVYGSEKKVLIIACENTLKIMYVRWARVCSGDLSDDDMCDAFVCGALKVDG